MNELKKLWNDVPPMFKLGIYAIGGYYAYLKINSVFAGLKTDSARKKALAEAESEGQKPTMGEYDYTTQAKVLYGAFRWYNDDEDAVYGVFRKLKNDVDYILLDKAFYDISKEDMASYIIDSFSNEEQGKVNDILAKAGIKYRL